MMLEFLFRKDGYVIADRSLWRFAAGGRWMLSALDFAPFVHKHGAQPAAKTLVLVVGELRQLADEKGENFLNEVGGVRLLQADAPRPIEE
jgi:hypothetical protein